jgi:hypothetical protein
MADRIVSDLRKALNLLGGVARSGNIPVTVFRGLLNSAWPPLVITADYTLKASDSGGMIVHNSPSGHSLIVPAGLAPGYFCTLLQVDAGQLTITASGVTIFNANTFTKTGRKGAQMALYSWAQDQFISWGDGA